ncbi:zinc finger protein 616-like [Scomber japonicus]|uniref:zinc finger protein 616-like n=1 Tax=Scomber japonicus TaxID=13676 RepID=UPI0023059712|nr:zinc finger protein 616-like [Scomber japonicus]
MTSVQRFRELINDRLTAAAEEIFRHFQTMISEYEAEINRQRRQLDIIWKPEIKLHRTDVQQQELVIKEEHQGLSSSVVQEHQEHPNIKEEGEAFLLTHFPVQNDDEEKSQLSQLHQRQTEENSESEPSGSSSTEQMKRTEADGEDCGFKCLSGSDGKTSYSSVAETEDNADWKETRKSQTDLNTMKKNASVNNIGYNTGTKYSCCKCGRRFGQKHHLQTHMRRHTGERPFGCTLCGKRFTQKGNLTKHLIVHTQKRPCSCPVCGETFAQRGNLTQHMTVHTREKLCW